MSQLEALENAYSGIIYDVLRSMGHANCVLPKTIRPLLINKKIVAPIFTIEGRVYNQISEHESLVKWCEMLSKAPSDHILVCQPNDNTVAHMGELSAETLTLKNVKGFVVDGGCRDSELIEKIGFPVWCRHYTPIDVVGRWAPESFEQPIEIGGVTIKCGDTMFADRDGVVVIPKKLLKPVTDKVHQLINTENLVRKAILAGTDPVDAYLKYGKF